MLKKTITYENPFTNELVSEDHYFHISKADLIEMEMEEHKVTYEKDGKKLTGMAAYLERITDSEDAPEAHKWIKAVLKRAYVKRDGDRSIKNAEVWAEFESTEAYSELIFELIANPEGMAAFFNAVFPKNLEKIAEELQEQAAKLKDTPSLPEGGHAPASNGASGARLLTSTEVAEMDGDELKSGLADGRYKLS